MLKVINNEKSGVEIEAKDLKIEKVAAAGTEIIARVKALKPGKYLLVNEYKEDTVKSLYRCGVMMLAAAVIVFREIIEAGLIVGILLAVTRGLENARLWIAGGVLAGIVGSCVVAGFTGILASAFAGAGQELFNATILGIAVVMLASHNIWMARHGRQMAASLKATGSAVSIGAKAPIALFVVVGSPSFEKEQKSFSSFMELQSLTIARG